METASITQMVFFLPDCIASHVIKQCPLPKHLKSHNSHDLCLHFLPCTVKLTPHPTCNLSEPWNAKELYVRKLQTEHQSCQ